MNRQRLTAALTGAALLSTGPVFSDADRAPASAATTTSQAERSDTPKQARPEVLESFQVGSGVYVRSLSVDQNNNSMWIGTSTGVMEVDLATRELRNTFTRDHGLANEYVFAIFVDSRGDKWFGTNAGGVSRYRDGAWDVYFPMHGLADYWIYSFAEQKYGPLWIGTWAGVNSLDLDTMTFNTYLEELVNEWVYAIDIDSSDRVWFGTEGGISMFDGENWQHWTHEDGLGAANTEKLPASPNTGLGTRRRHDLSILLQGRETYNPHYVFALLVDPQDQVWAGTWGGGVGRYDGERWTNYTTRDGLAGNIVYSIAQEKNGVLWFGTNHGVSRYDGKTWLTYDRSNGLLENNVYAISITPDGDAWIGTKQGVSRIGFKN